MCKAFASVSCALAFGLWWNHFLLDSHSMCNILKKKKKPDHKSFPVSEWINGFMRICEETEVKATYYKTALSLCSKKKNEWNFKTNQWPKIFIYLVLSALLTNLMHIKIPPNHDHLKTIILILISEEFGACDEYGIYSNE